MEITRRDTAIIQAAKLVLNGLEPHLRDTSTPVKKLIQAIVPIFDIRWGRNVVRHIGSKRLCDISRSLRNSKLPTHDYNKLPELWNTALALDTAFPDSWECWRALIGRFNLDDELPLSGWIPVIETCLKQKWPRPTKLARVDSNTVLLRMKAEIPLGHLFIYGKLQFWCSPTFRPALF